MEVERYKMIYTKIYTDKLLDISRSIEDQNDEFILNIYKEILSYDIRILGSDFVKNNKNKAKLIINNKKYALKEFINQKGSTSDEIKILYILWLFHYLFLNFIFRYLNMFNTNLICLKILWE